MNDIKQLRQRTGLSQSKFAQKYNISVRTLQQWEQGIGDCGGAICWFCRCQC